MPVARTPAWLLSAAIAAVSTLPSPAAAVDPLRRPQSAAAFQGNLIDAYIVANEVRADIQRATRLYLELGLQLRDRKSASLLTATIASVDLSIERFRRIKADSVTRRHFEKMLLQWLDLRALLTLPYDAANADLVYPYSEDLSISSSKLCFHLEDIADSEDGKLVDISGRLQSFAERIAKASLYGALTHKQGAEVDFITWRKEYEDGLALLESSVANDEYRRHNLALARTMWGLFNSMVTAAHRKQPGMRLVDISKSADGMWEIIRSNKRGYEDSLRRTLALSPPARRDSVRAAISAPRS